MPDVAAWNTREPVALAIFLERKGPNERISEAQEDWGMGRVPCWDRALPNRRFCSAVPLGAADV